MRHLNCVAIMEHVDVVCAIVSNGRILKNIFMENIANAIIFLVNVVQDKFVIRLNYLNFERIKYDLLKYFILY